MSCFLATFEWHPQGNGSANGRGRGVRHNLTQKKGEERGLMSAMSCGMMFYPTGVHYIKPVQE